MARIQYQGKVEVISTAGERITPDKWWRPVSQPIFRPFVVAVMASVFFVPEPIVAEVVTVDKWQQQHPEPVRKKVNPVSDSSFFVHDPLISIDRWAFKFDNPIRAKHLEFTYPNLFYGVKDFPPSMDWFSLPESPYRKQGQLGQALFFVPTSEVVTLDKWFSECLQFNPRLYVRKDYAYLYYNGCLLVFPLEMGTKVIHIDEVRQVLSRNLPPDVLRQGLPFDKIHIDGQPDRNWMRPGIDPTVK